jgi:hypothetical protein
LIKASSSTRGRRERAESGGGGCGRAAGDELDEEQFQRRLQTMVERWGEVSHGGVQVRERERAKLR